MLTGDNMGMPNEKTLKKMREKLKDLEGTKGLPENASVLEKFRWDICQKLVRYKQEHKCSQKKMAELAGVDEAKMSKILHHRIDEFSTDRLIAIYEKLNPNLRLDVG